MLPEVRIFFFQQLRFCKFRAIGIELLQVKGKWRVPQTSIQNLKLSRASSFGHVLHMVLLFDRVQTCFLKWSFFCSQQFRFCRFRA